MAVEAVTHAGQPNSLYCDRFVDGQALAARLMRSHAAVARRSALSCRGNLQAGRLWAREVERRCVLQAGMRRAAKRGNMY